MGENQMSNYVFAYYGEPQVASPEEGAKYKEKWQAWVGGLGEALVNPGIPFGTPKKVSARGITDNGGPNRLSGFSIVKADNLEEALDMAKGCPHLEHGSIDVAEAMDMGM